MIERMEPTETEITSAICALYGNGPMSESTLLEWIHEQRRINAHEHFMRYGGLNTLQNDPSLSTGTICVQFSKPKKQAKSNKAWLSCKRVGGLYHWRVGRIGGSFYISTRNAR